MFPIIVLDPHTLELRPISRRHWVRDVFNSLLMLFVGIGSLIGLGVFLYQGVTVIGWVWTLILLGLCAALAAPFPLYRKWNNARMLRRTQVSEQTLKELMDVWHADIQHPPDPSTKRQAGD